MKLYLVRHGETEMNARNLFYGWTDADINEKGIAQAEALRAVFRQIHTDAVYASDLRRAVHTAEIITEGGAIQTMPALRELHYGSWENRSWEEMTEADRAELRKWRTDWQGCTMPEGESFAAFYRRVTAAIDRVITENTDREILVVSHNGALSAILCHLTGAGQGAFWHFNFKQGHYSLLSIERGRVLVEHINHPPLPPL